MALLNYLRKKPEITKWLKVKPEISKETWGGKGFYLTQMRDAGFNVPPFMAISTDVCSLTGNKMIVAINDYSGIIYEKMFSKEPILVSVRSGAPISMPGMMETILNVGITKHTLDHWVTKLGKRAAYDSLRRLIQMYACTVHDVKPEMFEVALTAAKVKAGVETDAELTADQIAAVANHFFDVYALCVGSSFPYETVEEQLKGAIGAVFKSWSGDNAKFYRKQHGISDSLGTAVVVQRMVFGNLNDNSGSGVMFSRNPGTGKHEVVGEFLFNAQGEDVVAGIRTPISFPEFYNKNLKMCQSAVDLAVQLEKHFGDMQDIEFTVEDGQMFLLQTRTAKRSPRAAFKIAADRLKYGVSMSEIVKTINYGHVINMSTASLDPAYEGKHDAIGLAAGGGILPAVMAFDLAGIKQLKAEGLTVVFVAKETTPDDIEAIAAADGILTSLGGVTSHAAVVARGMGKACVVGLHSLKIEGAMVTHPLTEPKDGVHTLLHGALVSIDGDTGRVWFDQVKTIKEESPDADYVLEQLRQWFMQNGLLTNKANVIDLYELIVDNGHGGYAQVLKAANDRLSKDVPNLVVGNDFLRLSVPALGSQKNEVVKLVGGLRLLADADGKEIWFSGFEAYKLGEPSIPQPQTVADCFKYKLFRASDEFVNVVVGGQATYDKLKAAFGFEDYADPVDFDDLLARELE